MITRRRISLACGIGALVALPLSRGATAAPIRRVGYLGATSTAIGGDLREAFKQGMRDLGWQEGSNIEYRFAYTGGDMARLDTLANDLIAQVHEVVPGARRIAVLLNESHPSHDLFWAGAQAACVTLGLVALRVVASASSQLSAAVEQIVVQRAQAVVVTADPMYFAERAKLQELMQATRLPVAYGVREHVVAGGLLSYASNLAANFRYAVKWVDKILKGAKPADLPVEQPIRFELVINLKTAKTLGLKIPQTVLLRTDEVIE